MRKLLLSLFSILCVSLMVKAETYTMTVEEMFPSMTSNGNVSEWTCQGFSFTALKNSGGTNPAFNFTYKDLRLYAKNTLQISVNGCNITSISFAISAQGLKRYAEFTPSVGAVVEPGVNPLVWNGEADNITFTVGDKSLYGTDGATKAGQFDFESMTITTDGPVGEATPLYGTYGTITEMTEGSYLIWAENSIAIAPSNTYGALTPELVVIEDGKITTALTNAWEFIAVEGGYNIKDSKNRYMYQKDTYNTFNFSQTIDETIPQNYVWTVTIEDGKMKIFNTGVEKTIQYSTSQGNFGSYTDITGVLPVLYKFEEYSNEPGAEPPAKSVTALSQLPSLVNGEKFTMDVDLTVVYSKNSYNYVYDGTDYALIFKSMTAQPGDVITKGWGGSVSLYYKLIQLIPDATPTISGTAAVPEPDAVNVENAATQLVAANMNRYVRLADVTLAAATPSSGTFTGTMGEEDAQVTVNFYQRFSVSAEAGKYDVVGFVSVYNSTIQINPTEFINTALIDGITADQDAPATYYNIQGVKVDNPRQGGLYIRLQGGKATKVVF